MKVIINGSVEINAVSFVTEKMVNDGSFSLDIQINDSDQPLDKLKTSFENIKEVKVVREDLNNVEHETIFTKYTVISKIQRRLVDETDIITITLVSEGTVKVETEKVKSDQNTTVTVIN